MTVKINWQAVLALLLALVAVLNVPFVATGSIWLGVAAAVLVAIAAGRSMWSTLTTFDIIIIGFCTHLAVFLLLSMLNGNAGTATLGYFAALAASWLMGWRLVTILAGDGRNRGWFINLLIPALFGLWLLILWEAITRGAGVPFVLLPPPSAIGARFMASLPTLAADFYQTVMKAVLFGFIVGSFTGFLVAILADRYKFLSNGLLPIGNMVSALPIIGIAPIMVIWFGFDWQSKAAVVIVMTFFPMLVNTLAGLTAAGTMERDLMRTYASSHWQTLIKLRLPAAMPFIFNALKINSTLESLF